jgi:uncharacterized membrane protein
MSHIEETIEVGVPVRTAYEHWTDFEAFPDFMEGVEQVDKIGEKSLYWRTNVAGKHKEFDVTVTDERPDERVAWSSDDGPEHAGVVTFERLGENATRVAMRMDYEPDTLPEELGDALGVVEERVRGDLVRFKDLIEARAAGEEKIGYAKSGTGGLLPGE